MALRSTKTFQRNKPVNSLGDLISDDYRAQLEHKHKADSRWGTSGMNHAQDIADFIAEVDAKTVLDYGCGKNLTCDAVEVILRNLNRKNTQYTAYDPGILQFAALPDPADFVICTDVLEHVEPEKLDDVLKHLKSVILKAGFILVSTRAAKHILPDGRNAHLIIEDADWWIKAFEKHFQDFTVEINEKAQEITFHVVTGNYLETLDEDEGDDLPETKPDSFFQRIEVDNSSSIEQILIHPDNTLVIKFKSGQSYKYEGVSADLVDGFITAGSKGKYFQENIRGKFTESKADPT